MLIENGQKVLFIGDSITHWYSNWAEDGEDLGIGYVSMVARSVAAACRRKGDKFTFVNRGWSGDRVRHLVVRWEKDCLDHRPDWVSLYIGVNDCFGPDATPESVFATVSRNVDRAVWTKDGIHPTLAGHGLIADAWMKAVGAVEL